MIVFENALEVRQEIKKDKEKQRCVFYLASMKTGDIVKDKENNDIRPDQWDGKSNPDGYQRATNQKRSGNIKDFLIVVLSNFIFVL